MVAEGQKIDTDFSLDIVRNGNEQTVSFDELLDRPSIVSVYMRNNTSGCDKQNKSLAAEADWFDGHGYNLIAISKDSCSSHKNYAEKLGIHYVLASDPDYKFAKAADSIVEKKCTAIPTKRPRAQHTSSIRTEHCWPLLKKWTLEIMLPS